MSEPGLTIVAAVNDRGVLATNLQSSPGMAQAGKHQFLVQEGFSAAALAFNQALDRAQHDVVVFLHQDMYLPAGWFDNVRAAIDWLEQRNIAWGVLGTFGSRAGAAGGVGRMYATALGFHGKPLEVPEEVETLDEIVLIMRKSSGLRFDEALPHFHMYGVDLCMQARDRGLTNFAIPAFCIHNTNQLLTLPPQFYAAYRYVKRKWRAYLPIYTSCATITRFDGELRRRTVSTVVNTWLGRAREPITRTSDTHAFSTLCDPTSRPS
jgi:Glycosyltransferase like family